MTKPTLSLWLCLCFCFHLSRLTHSAPMDAQRGEPERIRVFEEPLVALAGQASAEEIAALGAALDAYRQGRSIDDFSSLHSFLERFPASRWNASLQLGLGIDCYNTAHYSKAIDAWRGAWALSKDSRQPEGKAIADRAVGELAYMYARLGRMEELSALLKSVEGRTFIGSATEKIAGAREGLWNMQHRPEISFRCGPLALHRIKATIAPSEAADIVIFESASTRRGMSLPQVAEISQKIGLNYQMAFREKGAAFIVPSVVHWKLGHYAAITKREGERFLLQDPTFINDTWATTNALESEASGYFLIPPGRLPQGWRAVQNKEGEMVWGKGVTASSNPGPMCPDDPSKLTGTRGRLCRLGQKQKQTPYPKYKLTSEPGSAATGRDDRYRNELETAGRGMAVADVHLMLVNLNIVDSPVGYTPPIGPNVEFTVRYNHRDAFQPATFTYANFGPKWTCDWVSYINDNPQSPSANVNHYVRGGGTRTFTGFDTNSQRFAPQAYDQTRLTRTGPESYEMLSPDGSKLIFARSDGASGTSRKIFLTQILDPFGNAVTLNYDASLRLTNIVDAIGQATTLSYSNASDIYKITRVTDPFGRFAQFDYDSSGRLTNITDVIGIKSRFIYEGSGDFIQALVTPYGTTSFTRGGSGTTRWLETVYPDGSKDRVEFQQGSNVGIPFSDPPASVPRNMSTFNQWLYARNTYYWDRTACAQAYGDYTKAKIYHWLHEVDLNMTAGVLESFKEPLEGRVWFDYPGQPSALQVGASDEPRRIGRVLDDGQTQLYSYEYNEFGNVTNSVDPLGRTLSYLYSTNGIDLLEVRMTRAGKNELLFSATYNAQHLPLTTTDAAGQTTTNTYNARGQLLTTSNPKGETTAFTYDTNGFLIAVDGPLPGTNDTHTATYDAFGRTRTKTDDSGYTITFNYDALDRITNVTFPDGTFDQVTYNRLDPEVIRDRAGRETRLEHNAVRDLVKQTDPLGRVTQFQWCRCGSIKSLTDPMGRTTHWHTDVQGRVTAKEFGDGSRIRYNYENATSRLREIIDEKLQMQQFAWNIDDTLRTISYRNASVPTAPVMFAYDADYARLIARTDGSGTTVYEYFPVTGTPTLGAGQPSVVDGPLANDTVTYEYDELGRRVAKFINGLAQRVTFDALGRLIAETNVLGAFSYAYDGSTRRRTTESFPYGISSARVYENAQHDFALKELTHQAGASLVSQFIYGRDAEAERIVTWSQQFGAQAPRIYAFGYDAADQLLSAAVTNAGVFAGAFGYSYDPAGNRVREETLTATNVASYNALNQLSVSSGGTFAARTNEWDARDRLVAVNGGNTRTEFTYDGDGQLVAIRQLVDGVETSLRRFIWTDGMISEERDGAGAITKRFFANGVRIESGPSAGTYFYTRDHLNSIRELLETNGAVRARYSYDPFGRRTLVEGDVDSDFGYAGMFWSREAQLSLTLYRAYDPEQGRWLSRDPLRNAEIEEGANLYAYVGNNPINATDPLGLCCVKEMQDYVTAGLPIPTIGLSPMCDMAKAFRQVACGGPMGPMGGQCAQAQAEVLIHCELPYRQRLLDCMSKPCQEPPCGGTGGGIGRL
jgi:RHS repeat-associated protein